MENFLTRYQEVMRIVWDFPENDQRPYVISLLRRWFGTGRRILDIGAGNGYYLPSIAPEAVIAVEPNPSLRNCLRNNTANLGFSLHLVESIGSLDGFDDSFNACDLVLLIHVLFYLNEAEWRYLLHRVMGLPLFLVHPDPEGAVTVAFEDFVGQSHSRLIAETKTKLLGRPSDRERTASHFRVPKSIDDDDLAFLVAHPVLQRGGGAEVMDAASEFVRIHRDSWNRESWIELPQPQIIERYNAVPPSPVRS